MKTGIRKGLSLLLAGILSLALICAWPGMSRADATGDVSGSTAAATSFDVTVNGNGSGYIRLFATKGAAYIADYDFYGHFNGYKTEPAYGFYRVEVTGSGYSQNYFWVPSASMSTSSSNVQTSQSLVVVFPVHGVYRVTVTPLTQQEINGVYWAQNRFQNWTTDSTWIVNKAVNCDCGNASGGGSFQPQNAQVTVYCYDTAGSYLRAYTETIAGSRTIYPQAISGYTAVSGGQYITDYGNGTCSPATVTFKYQKAQTSGTVTVYCYDTAGNYLTAYNETITGSRTIYPQAVSGYNATSGGQYITFSNGVCSPSSVTFKYQKVQTSGTVTVYCYDTNGSFISSYTETITASRHIYPKTISGYTTPSGSQYITFSNGVCSPASVTFKYQAIPTSGTVTVYCYDTNGSFISSYTETVTASRHIYPKTISGYSTPSGSQYVTYSNGICNPASVTFKYQKIPTSATVTVNCYDTNGAYIRSYTETISASKTIYPQNISGYNVMSGGEYITYSNGTCTPNTVTFKYQPYATSATVTISCYDTNGTFITSYTETLTASKTINPQAISGYTIASGGQYVTFSNGVCTPSSITFKYQKIQNPATLNIDCYDTDGNYIRSYTETITGSRTVYPQAISGYDIVSGGQAVKYNDGTCSPNAIAFSYSKIPTPASVTIRCIDTNGNVIRTTTETITATKTIKPPKISGYTALSSAKKVKYNDGTCSPSRIDFEYQIGKSVDPGTDPRAAYPTSWDTQFKPGTARDGNGNENQIVNLPNIADDNPSTTFGWIWWSSESDMTKDFTPELTAYFDGATTIKSIGIRNGNLANGSGSYNGYARVKKFLIKVYDVNENEYEVTISIPDKYTKDYQEFSLGKTCKNVSRVEFWIAGYYNGANSKHVIHISDMIFYK